MPKDTFHNLAASKREAIIEAALEEFALKDYKDASISRIVRQLGIAKGSMYQYFENKEDLYLHLVEIVQLKKFEVAGVNLDLDPENLFEWIKATFQQGLNFDKDYPLYSGFNYNLARQREGLPGDLSRKMKKQAMDLFENYLKHQQEAGRVRKDLPLSIMSFSLIHLLQGILDYFELQYGFNLDEKVKNREAINPVSDEKFGEIISQLVEVLQFGMNSV